MLELRKNRSMVPQYAMEIGIADHALVYVRLQEDLETKMDLYLMKSSLKD
jgi:hypothetical protein